MEGIGQDILERFRARHPGLHIELVPYEIFEATGIVLVTGREGFEEPVHRCPECGSQVESALFEEAGVWDGFVGTRSRWGFACRSCGWMGFEGELPKARRWEWRTWSREELWEEAQRPIRAVPMNSEAARRKSVRWALQAIERHLEEVRRAPQGARNQTLARAAAAVGGIIARAGEEAMPIGEAEERLLDAAMACGLKRDEALSTIKRQLRWGLERGR